MMQVMTLDPRDSGMGAACHFPEVAAAPEPPVYPAPPLRRAEPVLPEQTNGPSGYAPSRHRKSVLGFIIALHVVGLVALASARFEALGPPAPQRISSFSLSEPPPPPPLEAAPEPAAQPIAAPLVAPPVQLAIPRVVELPAAQPAPVVPGIVPVALTVPTAAPATPQDAPPAPAPIVPPDFSAEQLRNPGPSYPYISRKAREEGVVLLKVLVSVDGRAARLDIEETSGFKRLDEAALKTVAKWRFIPAKQAGQPCEAWVLVPVTFALG